MGNLRDCPALRAEAATSVAEVVERLREIRDGAEQASAGCGIAQFSELYLTITQSIAEHIRAGSFFADDAYLGRLDVAFGNRYFDALRAWATGGRAPRSWELLFEAPNNGEITALQLAGAGVNAHINFDLAVATVDTGREMGDAELAGRWDDYARINDVFAQNMDALLNRFLEDRAAAGEDPEPLSARGRLMTRIVAAARQFAWEDAEVLWALPRRSEAWESKERHMDAVASLIGRGVLVDLPG
ncbi:MAG: DUF5995 family protein [Actinomycetota bacterium]